MSKIVALPALAIGTLGLTACTGQTLSYLEHDYSGANCAPAHACAPGAGYGQYASSGGAFAARQSYGAASIGQPTGTISRYGGAPQLRGSQYYQQYVYANRQPLMLRAAPMQMYTQPGYSYHASGPVPSLPAPAALPAPRISRPVRPSPRPVSAAAATYASLPANCPAGTTAQNDGTCLQGGSYSPSSIISSGTRSIVSSSSTTSYSDAPTYSAPAYSETPSYTASHNMTFSTPAASLASAPANCPAGTRPAADGSCLQDGGGSFSFSGSSISAADRPAQTRRNGIAPPISSYDWGSKSTAYGLSGYVSPGTRTVDSAPASYPSISADITSDTVYGHNNSAYHIPRK